MKNHKSRFWRRSLCAFSMLFAITLFPHMVVTLHLEGSHFDPLVCLARHAVSYLFIGGTLAVALLFQRR